MARPTSVYLWVPELHADGERYHVHFAVGRFVHRGWIDEAWGRGFVHIKLLGDLPTGSGSWGDSSRDIPFFSTLGRRL